MLSYGSFLYFRKQGFFADAAVRRHSAWSPPDSHPPGTCYGWADGSLRRLAAFRWHITTDPEGPTPSIAQGARAIGTRQTPFDAELAGIEATLRHQQKDTIIHETLSVPTASTHYMCYAPTKIVHALYRPTIVSVRSIVSFTPTLSLSPNIHAVPTIITSVADIHVVSAAVITFTCIHVVPAINPLLGMHKS